MKKRIYGILAIILVMLSSVFISACGNKYKNLEFEISYAFSEDASEWFNASDGLSLSYSDEEQYVFKVGDNEYAFDKNNCNIYFKVNIKNVKSKYIDLITVSAENSEIYGFDSKNVEQGQVFAFPVKTIVDTKLSFYENASSKSKSIDFEVYKNIKEISRGTSVNPAVIVGGQLDLKSFSNLITYNPNQSQTKQTEVEYQLTGLGYFNNEGNYTKYSSANGVELNDDVISVNPDYVPGVNSNSVIEIAVVSKYNSEITTTVYVNIVENISANPVVTFKNNGISVINATDRVLSGMDLYFTTDKTQSEYETTLIVENPNTSIYKNGIYTANGLAELKTVLYINGENYTNYKEHNSDIVVLNVGDEYRFLLDEGFEKNSLNIKFAFEFEGLDFLGQNFNLNEEFILRNHVLADSILLNDISYKDDTYSSDVVYDSTAQYKGYEVKVGLSPVDNFPDIFGEQKIVVDTVNASDRNKVEITNSKGDIITLGADSAKLSIDDVIYVKVKSGYTGIDLKFETLASPTYYNGQTLNYAKYISTTLKLSRQVTASNIEVVSAGNAENYYVNGYQSLSQAYVGANTDRSIYVRIEHKGTLTKESVSLVLDSESGMTFGNGLTTTTLYDAAEIDNGKTIEGSDYTVYKILVKATGVETSSKLMILAGNGNVGASASVLLESKFIMQEYESLKVETSQNLYVKTIAQNIYAVEKGEEVKFKVVSQNAETNNKAIKEIDFERVQGSLPVSVKDRFTSLKEPNVISNYEFLVQTSGDLTHIFKLVANCYVDDGMDSVKLENKVIENVQFAVYKPIQIITANFELSGGKQKDTIAYVNSEFKEITTTTITYNATWSDKTAPTDSVYYFNGSGIYSKVVNCADLTLSLNKSLPTNVKILQYNATSEKFEEIINYNEISLNNRIQVSLTSDFVGEKYKDISLVFNAKDDGMATASKTMKVNFADVDKSTGIDISGESIVEYSDTAREIQLSFLGKTADISKSFTAHVSYNNSNQSQGLRFEDLSYELYKYLLDANGNKVYQPNNGKYEPVLQPVRDIQIKVLDKEEDNIVITASYSNRNNVGGEYCLILNAKDSYNDDEKKYENSWPVTIRVGTGDEYSPYLISSKDDYKLINNELSKHYVLTNNINLNEITTQDIIGVDLIGNTALNFSGSLSGKLSTNNVNGSENVFTYTITATIKDRGIVGNADNFYYSLITSNSGKISNLNFVLNYAITDDEDVSGIYMGVCGANSGTIENVVVEISGDINIGKEIGSTKDKTLYLGAITGSNSGTISGSKVYNNEELSVKLADENAGTTVINANIGLVAGVSTTGLVSGSYQGKDSLNSISYDVTSNLTLTNEENGEICFGGVVGYSEAEIKNFIVSGGVKITGIRTPACIGGIAGSTEGNINCVAVFGMNIESESEDSSLSTMTGGIAGSSSANITNARYISASTKINGILYLGQITANAGSVAGIVAGGSANLENCTVENFIETITVSGGDTETFYPILGSSAACVYGLAKTSGNVKNSFVRANLKSDGTVYLTSNASSEDLTYFIGKASYTNYESNSSYYIIIDDNGAKSEASGNVSTLLNSYTDSLSDWNSGIATEFGPSIIGNENDTTKFAAREKYNTINLTDIDKDYLNLPYILFEENCNTSPLMILAPTSIKASINSDYWINATLKYVYIDNYENDAYSIEETIVIDYLNDRYGNEVINTYELTNASGTGLLDLIIEPSNDANITSGLTYELVGNSSFYAKLESGKIIFTGVSGNEPIVLKCYSAFNMQDTTKYIAFYTQYTYSEMKINGATKTGENEFSIKVLDNAPTSVKIGAINQYLGNSYSTIFERLSASNFDITVTSLNSKLKVDVNELTLVMTINGDFNDGDGEVLTITVSLKEDVFDYNGNHYVTSNVVLETLTLNVEFAHAANDLKINGGDSYDFETHTSLNINAQLTTGYIDETITGEETFNYETETGKTDWYKDAEISFTNTNTRDSIKMQLSYYEYDNGMLDDIKEKTGYEHIIDLFDFEVYTTLLEGNIGYNYNISIKLKEGRDYRYITEDIKLKLTIYATSNQSKSVVTIITLKPTTVSTVRISNFNVERINVKTDTIDELTMGGTESNIITPGGRGSIMVINLTPTYSKIDEDKAYLITDYISVPSLGGKQVGLKFIQLVYNKTSGKFETAYHLFTETQIGDRLKLDVTTSYKIVNGEVEKDYDGRIFVYVQLEGFSGYEAGITATLEVTSNGKVLTTEKTLITTYLPGANLCYQGKSSSAMIQEGTFDNVAELVLYGYQFNSNPDLNVGWEIPDGVNYFYKNTNYETVDSSDLAQAFNNGDCLYYKSTENKYYKIKSTNFNSDGDFVADDGKTANAFYKVTNKEIINFYGSERNVNNYVSASLVNNYQNVIKNVDGSYTMQIKFSIGNDLPTAFSLSAGLTLRTADGTIVSDISSPFVFEPTQYIIKDVAVKNTSTNKMLLAINRSKSLEFIFNTDNEEADFSAAIYTKMVDDIGIEALKQCFTYGGGLSFAEVQPEFEISVSGNVLVIYGLKAFSNLITFDVNYSYVDINGDGKKVLTFTTPNGGPNALNYSFTLQIYSGSSEDNAIAISSATEFKDMVAGGHYVLMNDITLENYTPINFEGSSIGSLDGNNKVIKIKSFAYDTSITEYGLFGSIGSYQEQSGETTRAILKNVIVDYSIFEGGIKEDGTIESTGTLNLSKFNLSNITFGGLVANNNGGLIYNCDVMNLGYTDKTVEIVVKEDTSIVFGGLVGKNTGNITNSRVGRSSYLSINAEQDTTVTKNASTITFAVGNSKISDFENTSGGFVGINNGIIASSYFANTSLINYSSSEKTNQTAGFVAVNESSGIISYSYVKALDNNNTINAYSTGRVIEGKSNSTVAGFVYQNKGTIRDSFANTELKTESAYMAGFVYNHSAGLIENSYAACTMNSGTTDSNRDNAEQPFVGKNSKNQYLVNGTFSNTYYLLKDGEVGSSELSTGITMPVGVSLNNFQDSSNLYGFVFVNSTIDAEREQGVWSYIDAKGKLKLLPELTSANIIAHSSRYLISKNDDGIGRYRDANSYILGTKNNPDIIRSVEEFNEVFVGNKTDLSEKSSKSGYVRFIDNIDFSTDNTAIKTRVNFTLGNENYSYDITSIDGNGMKISGIYLDAAGPTGDEIGLFAKITNAFVKNLKLDFINISNHASTSSIKYHGGLAGYIEDSIIINVELDGDDVLFTGENFVGGLAGAIKGQSLIYGVKSNISVRATSVNKGIYTPLSDYLENGNNASTYESAMENMSYAGGLAGVLDMESRGYGGFNISYVEIKGNEMQTITENDSTIANISAVYAGGVAGYSGAYTSSFKVKYIMGTTEYIEGVESAAGLYAISLGKLTACQVSAVEETQYVYDTAFGEYVMTLAEKNEASIETSKSGNLGLIRSGNIAGGLIGVGLIGGIDSSYSKASISNAKVAGGMIGVSFATSITYSYAIPYLAFSENLVQAGGMIGSAHIVNKTGSDPENNAGYLNYEAVAIKHAKKNYTSEKLRTDLQYTFSTIIFNQNDFIKFDESIGENGDYVIRNSVKINYICPSSTYVLNGADPETVHKITSAGESISKSAFYGTINYKNMFSGLNEGFVEYSTTELQKLYFTQKDASEQKATFEKIFSDWTVIPYWSLDESKYFPLLLNNGIRNWILIERADDFRKLTSNPSGEFLVVEDIDMANGWETGDSNWVLDTGNTPFSGILMGEIDSEKGTRKRIYNISLTPGQAGESAGFLKETAGATISNLIFEWVSDSNGAIQPKVENLGQIAGISCTDTYVEEDDGSIKGSVFSNLDVVVGNNSANYLFNSTDCSITGFAGLVYTTVNSSINNCLFSGQISACVKSNNPSAEPLDAHYFAGLVGYAECNSTNGVVADEEGLETTPKKLGSMNILNCKVGINHAKTSINISNESELSNVYLAGAVGKAYCGTTGSVVISSISVGSMTYEESCRNVTLTAVIKNNDVTNFYAGGLVAYAEHTKLSESDSLTEIKIESENSNQIETAYVGGVAGEYIISSADYGLSLVNSKTDISYKSSTNNLSIAGGLANLKDKTSTGYGIQRCLFTGSIIAEQEDSETFKIINADAGGMIGAVTSGTLSINESMSTTEITVSAKDSLNMGGIVGKYNGDSNDAKINNSISSGKIVPVCTDETGNGKVFAAGFVGYACTGTITISNSYSVSSIISDGVKGKTRTNAIFDTIVAQKTGNISAENVMVSSDISMAEHNNVPDVNNISAVALYFDGNEQIHSGSNTQGFVYKANHEDASESTGIWTRFKFSDSYRLPYLTNLYSQMLTYIIIEKVGAGANPDYVLGSALNPVIINNETTGFDGVYSGIFTYYVLGADVNTDNMQQLTGVLIGMERTFNVKKLNSDGEYHGTVAVVKKHSAISNLHINVDFELSVDNGYYSYIAGQNNGYIFNCSVQGTNVKITGGGPYLGIIVGNNKGVVSHSYSSAELMTCETSTSGIVYTNEGTIDSCYFTGYINNTEASAGVVVNNSNGYIFNSYMAGVVETIQEESNSFSYNNDLIDDSKGSNNFVDMYANLELSKESVTDVLEFIPTANLMEKSGLAGNWYTTVTDGVINQTSTTFGKNYGYPVYKFNKTDNPYNSEIDTTTLDAYYSLNTGTGVKNTGFTQAERYLALTTVGIGSKVTSYAREYQNAYKIPHFGVLCAVENLLSVDATTDSDFNYVIIYDLGNFEENLETTNCIDWSAIGNKTNSETSKSGFKGVSASSDTLIGFNGVIVSNKGIDLYQEEAVVTPASAGAEPEPTEDHSICTISGLTKNGLFAGIHNAYIGNINLGTFHKLENSGALGIDVAGTTVVNSVSFIDNSIVTGNSTGYVGGLFGTISIKTSETEDGAGGGVAESESETPEPDEVVETSDLTIINFGTPDNGVQIAGYVCGLIAGQATSGKIDLDATNQYIVNFSAVFDVDLGETPNINIAGGLIGEVGESKVVTLGIQSEPEVDIGSEDFNVSIFADDKVKIKVLNVISSNSNSNKNGHFGGVIGKINTEFSIYVTSVYVEFDDGAVDQYKVKDFGGLVYENNAGFLQMEDVELKLPEQISVTGYVGGVVAKLDSNSSDNKYGNIKLSTLNFLTDKIVITGDESDKINSATGTISAYHFGNVEITSELRFATESAGVTIKVINRDNLGGISGIYQGGNINIKDIKNKLKLDGTTNVGGVFGLAKEMVAGTKSDESYKFTEIEETLTPEQDYMELIGWSDNKFKNITIVLNDNSSNVGGLIGLSYGDIYDAQSSVTFVRTDDTTIDYSTTKINVRNLGGIVGSTEGMLINCENNSDIKLDSNVHAINVGGITGKLITIDPPEIGVSALDEVVEEPAIENGVVAFNCVNKAIVLSGNMSESLNESLVDTMEGFGTAEYGQMNVGGLFGQVETQHTTQIAKISNCFNAEGKDEDPKISGYQNVGGIVGYINAGNGEILITGESLVYSTDEDDESAYTIGNDGNLSPKEEIKFNVGNASGVLNVGGVVGYADSGESVKITIDTVYSSMTVKGNSNVGGLAGYVGKNVEIKNNIVGSKNLDTFNYNVTDGFTIQTDNSLTINGVYYHYIYTENKAEGKVNKVASYIPTSIGGLVGVSNTNQIYENNAIHNVTVSTMKETETITDKTNTFITGTINTISNYIFNEKSGDNYNGYVSLNNTRSEVSFDNTISGIGGYAGTVNSTLKVNQTNAIKDLKINAPLGINVGTYYGAYGADYTDTSYKLPRIYHTSVTQSGKTYDDEITIDGAYMVGGIIGQYLGATGLINGLSNTSIENTIYEANDEGSFVTPLDEPSQTIEVKGVDEHAVIKLQSQITAINVGGLIGKLVTKAAISNLELNNNDTDVYIVIETSKSYNIGGHIGYLQMTSGSYTFTGGKISGSVTTADTILSKVNAENFGAFIGLLKCSDPSVTTYKVNGTHYYPFTVNTIENQNYADGKSNFNTTTDSSKIYLNAIASYVNLDSFNISASSNRELYDGTDDKNILRTDSKGWAMEYTAFKKIQRCIPESKQDNSQNAQAEIYDAVATVYDAEYITHVGTVQSLGLLKIDGDGKYIPKDGSIIREGSLEEGYTYYVKSNPDKKYNKDDLAQLNQHIIYTVYEKEFGSPMLYSAAGVAGTIQTETGDIVSSDSQYYQYHKKVQETDPSHLGEEWNNGSVGIEVSKENFIDYDGTDYTYPMKIEDLVYFNWVDRTRLIKTKYTGEDQCTINLASKICYYILDGKYYDFNKIYANDSIKNLTAEKVGNYGDLEMSDYSYTSSPKSGSVLEACGVNPKMPSTETDERTWWDKFGGYVIAGVIAVIMIFLAIVTWGASAWATAPLWMYKVAFAVGTFSKAGMIIWGASLSVAIATSCTVQAIVNNNRALTLSTNLYYSIYDQQVGLMTTTIRTPISYDGNFQTGQQQNMKFVEDTDGEVLVYSYYSRLRPDDIYTDYYVYLNYSKIGNLYNPTELNDESLMSTVPEDYASAGWNVTLKSGCEYQFTLTRTGDAIPSESVEKNDTFTAYRKYIYADGSYYYYTLSGTQEYKITQDLNDINELELTQYQKATKDGCNYIYGSYDPLDNTYSFTQPTDKEVGDNNVIFDGSKYSLNGVELSDAYVNEHVIFDKPVNFKYTSSDVTDIQGYDYMKGAYYTLNGDTTQKDAGLYSKYVHFEYCGNSIPSGFTVGKDCYMHTYEDTGGNPITQYYKMTETIKTSATASISGDMSSTGIDLEIYPYTFDVNKVKVQVRDTCSYIPGSSNLSHTVRYYLYDGGYKRGADIGIKYEGVNKSDYYDGDTFDANRYNTDLKGKSIPDQVAENYENAVYKESTVQVTTELVNGSKIYAYDDSGNKVGFDSSNIDTLFNSESLYTSDITKFTSEETKDVEIEKAKAKYMYMYVKKDGKYYIRDDSYVIDKDGRLNGLTLVGGNEDRKYHLANKYLLNATWELYSTFAYTLDGSNYLHFTRLPNSETQVIIKKSNYAGNLAGYNNAVDSAKGKSPFHTITVENEGEDSEQTIINLYYLVPSSSDLTHPNIYTTHFVESCNVILGGGYTLQYLGTGTTVISGTFTIE